MVFMTDSRFAPSQWEMLLLCKDISYWLVTSLESALVLLSGPGNLPTNYLGYWPVWDLCFIIYILMIFIRSWCQLPGAVSILRCRLTRMGIPMLKIKQSPDRLIFDIEIPIPGKDGLCIETGPWPLYPFQQYSGITWVSQITGESTFCSVAFKAYNKKTIKIPYHWFIVSVWVKYFVWNFKGTLWNSIQKS